VSEYPALLSTRSLLVSFVRRAASIYFREIEVVGEPPSAETGGRIFGANHTNGLIDPILVLTHAPCVIAPLAKSTLWKIPVLRWMLDAVGAVAVKRKVDDPSMKTEANDGLFEATAKHLGGGGNLLIFPEGVSHTEPHVVKLKTGAGRMLARAHEEGARGLTFQAVGIEFDALDSFRSRALVVYGPVRKVDAIAERGGDLVKEITEELREDLSELVVEGATWSERVLIARVAQLFANDTGDGSLASWNEIGRQVEAARKMLGQEADDRGLYASVERTVSGYYAALEEAGLRDAEVASTSPSKSRGRLARRLRLAVALPLALPGVVLYWLPYQIPRLVTRGDRQKSRDLVSTKKLATGLVVFPLWAGALLGASFALLPLPVALAAGGVIVLSPFAALMWLDHLEHGARGKADGDLRAQRARVMDVLARARAEIAPARAAVQ